MYKRNFLKVTSFVLLFSLFLSTFLFTEVKAATFIQPDTEITVNVPLATQLSFVPKDTGIYEFEITDLKHASDFNPYKDSTKVYANEGSQRWECQGTTLAKNIKIPFLCERGKLYNIEFDCDYEYLKFIFKKSDDFHDDAVDTATAVEVGKQIRDYSEHWRDIDWYSFTPTEDGYYRVKSMKPDSHTDINVNFSDNNDLKCTLFNNGTAFLSKSVNPDTKELTNFTKLIKGTTYYFAIDEAAFSKYSGSLSGLRAEFDSKYPINYSYRFKVEKAPEITGNLKFKSDQGIIPATNFEVELMEKSPIGDNVVGKATVDKNGDFNVKFATIEDTDKGELYFKVQAGDDFSVVKDPDPAKMNDDAIIKYNSEVKNASEIKDGKLDFGSNELQPAGAFNIVYNIHKAAKFFSEAAPDVGAPQKVNVFWDPAGKSEAKTQYWQGINSIIISSNPFGLDEYDPSVIDHEYGHYLMANFANVPQSAGGSHSFNTLCETTGKAYSEGWATFFGQMALNTPEYSDNGGPHGNLEYPKDGAHPKSPYNEVSVAATLWDLADANSEIYTPQYVDNAGTVIGDNLNEAFSGVKNVFLQNNGYSDIESFWNNWISTYTLKDDIYKAWQIFKNEGLQFDHESPSIDSVDVPATPISGLQQVQANVSDNVMVAKVYFNGAEGTKASEGIYNYVIDPSKYAKGNNILLVWSEDQAYNIGTGRNVIVDASNRPVAAGSTASGKPSDTATSNSSSYDIYSKPYMVQYSDSNIAQNYSCKAVGFVVAESAAGQTVKTVATINDISKAITDKGYSVQATGTKVMGTTGKSDAVSFTVKEGRDYCLMLHSLDGVFQLEIYSPDGALYKKINNPEIPTGVELKGCTAGLWTYRIVSDSVPFDGAIVAHGVGERVGEVNLDTVTASVKNNLLTFTGKAFGASSVSLLIKNGSNSKTLNANVVNNSFTFTNASLYDGENILTFSPIDASGKSGDPVSRVVVVDKTTPELDIQVETQTPLWSLGDTSPIAAYSDSVKLSINITKPGKLWVDNIKVDAFNMNEDRTSATVDKDLISGSNVITVKAEDDLGNVVQKTVTVVRSTKGTYETTIPTISGISLPTNGVFSNIHNVTVTVSDSSPVKVEAFMDNTPLVNDGNNNFKVDIINFYARNYNFIVKVTDVWGNTTLFKRIMLVNSDGSRPTKTVDNDGPIAYGKVNYENISGDTQFKCTVKNVKDPSGVTNVQFDIRPKSNPAATPFIIEGTPLTGTYGELNYEAIFDTTVIPFGDVDYSVITTAEDKCGNESILDSRIVSKKMMYREEKFNLFLSDTPWLESLIGVTHFDTWAYAKYTDGNMNWVLLFYDNPEKTNFISEPVFVNWQNSLNDMPLTEPMDAIKSDEQLTSLQRLTITMFEGGAITRIPGQTVTSRLYTPYYRKWVELGGDFSILGLPLSNSYYDQAEEARSIDFTNGKICWSLYFYAWRPFNTFVRPKTPIIESAIYERFRQNPQLGNFVGTYVHDTLFSYVKCDNGVIFFTNDVLKTFIISNDFFEKWLEIYNTTAYTLGAPIAEEQNDNNGWRYLEGEVSDLYWNSATGFVRVSNQTYRPYDGFRDGILRTWKTIGGASGVLGYPITSVIYPGDGTCYCKFQNGTLNFASGKTTVTELTGSTKDTIVSLQPNQNINNTVPVIGVISTPANTTAVKIYVDGNYVSDAEWESSTGIFSGTINANSLPYGEHSISAKAVKSDGTEVEFSSVSVSAVPRMIGFDNQVLAGSASNSPAPIPSINSSVSISSNSIINYSGYAMDLGGVKNVEVYVDEVYQGTAAYGQERQDLAAQYPKYGTANVGFQYSLDTSNFTKTTHQVEFVVVPVTNDSEKISIKTSFSQPLIPTPPPPAVNVKVNSMNEDVSKTTNILRPIIELENTGTNDVDLANVQIRYYFTDETGLAPIADLYYTSINKDNVKSNFVQTDSGTNPGYYLDISFTSNAGILTPGNKLTLKYGIHNSSWTNYSQCNDISFIANQSTFTENKNISVYYSNNLVWGNEQMTPPTEPDSMKVQYFSEDNSARTNAIKPALRLVNTGNSSISLADVKIQYHFNNETVEPQVAEVYWADCGSANVTSTIAKSSLLPSGNNYYMEIAFNQSAGTLAPGASIVIKTGIHTQNYSLYTQGNDFSFNPEFAVFSDQPKITGLFQNNLIWGTAPVIVD